MAAVLAQLDNDEMRYHGKRAWAVILERSQWFNDARYHKNPWITGSTITYHVIDFLDIYDPSEELSSPFNDRF